MESSLLEPKGCVVEVTADAEFFLNEAFFYWETSVSLLLMLFLHVSQWWLAFKPHVLPEKYIC